MAFLLFVAATIGLTNIVVHGKILDDDHLGLRSWLRKKLGLWADLLDCYECAGFWCGALMGLMVLSWNPLPAAFAGAGIMHAYVTIMNHLTKGDA